MKYITVTTLLLFWMLLTLILICSVIGGAFLLGFQDDKTGRYKWFEIGDKLLEIFSKD